MRSRPRPSRWLSLALVAVAAPAALVAQEPADSAEREARSNREPATVEITNEHWQDLNIFTVRSGMRMRLGTVTSFSTVTFELPRWALVADDVRLLAEPIGSRRQLFTDRLIVWSGDLIVWNVRNNLALSRLSVFRT